MYKRYTQNYCCCTGTVHCRFCIRAGKPAHLTVDQNYNTVLIINKEPINELQKMDKINTQQDAVQQVKNGTYIIGSVAYNGDVSFSPNPSIQYNSQSARAECKRLADISPGKLFIFVKLSGGEMVPNNTISI